MPSLLRPILGKGILIFFRRYVGIDSQGVQANRDWAGRGRGSIYLACPQRKKEFQNEKVSDYALGTCFRVHGFSGPSCGVWGVRRNRRWAPQRLPTRQYRLRQPLCRLPRARPPHPNPRRHQGRRPWPLQYPLRPQSRHLLLSRRRLQYR